MRRAAGYAQGTLPLVSFVDPDDLYEASAFTQLADALDACPQAVMAYTDEALTDENGQDIAGAASGLQPLAARQQRQPRARPDRDASIRRRSRAQGNHRPQHNFADWLLTLLVAKRGGVLYLPIVGRSLATTPRSKATEPAIRKLSGAFAKHRISGDKPCHRPTRTLDSTTAGRSAKAAGTPAWTPTSSASALWSACP